MTTSRIHILVDAAEDGLTRDGRTLPIDRLDAGALFRDHATFVAKFLWRLGAPENDLDDMVQEVFLIAHTKGGFAPGPAQSTTWLAEIAFRVASDRRRRRERTHSIAPEKLENIAATAPLPVEKMEMAEDLSRVNRALDSLRLRHRAVFVLYELMGLSCESIAGGLGLRLGTVYSRLHHARSKFLKAHAKLVALEKKRERGAR